MSWAEFGLPDCEFTTPYTAMRGLWIALYNLTKTQYVLGLSSSPNGSIYTLQQVKAYMPNLIFSNKPAYSSPDTMWGTIRFDAVLTNLLAQFIDPDNSEIVGGYEPSRETSTMVVNKYSHESIETKLGGNYPGIGIVWANTKKFTPHLFALWAKQRIEILKLLKQSYSGVHATFLHKRTIFLSDESGWSNVLFDTDELCQRGEDEIQEHEIYEKTAVDTYLKRHEVSTSEYKTYWPFVTVSAVSDYLNIASAYHALYNILNAPKSLILRVHPLFSSPYPVIFDPFYTGIPTNDTRYIMPDPIDWTGLTHQEASHSFMWNDTNFSWDFGFRGSIQAIVDYTDLLHMEEGPSEADLDDGLGV